MKIISYQSQPPVPDGEFIDRNPNISYLLTSSGQNPQSILVDASVDPYELKIDLGKIQSTLTQILITHNHHDHTSNLSSLHKIFPYVHIGIPELSLPSFSAQGYSNLFALNNNMQINFGDEVLSVWHTPGHTFDSICFWNEKDKAFFSGDTLFGGGIGCSDYNAGGNRNIFYQTIADLINRLKPESTIYPGHFSEKYQVWPPYTLAKERTDNPYIVNVIQGKRGNFDLDLKEFSIEFENYHAALMDESMVDKLYELEKQSWAPELQASRELILNRIRWGHKILGLQEEGETLGMACWRYSGFSIQAGKDRFPRSFMEFSRGQGETGQLRSAFIYNVGVKAGLRQIGIGSLLLQEAFQKIREQGISQVFVDCRIPSYNGSRQLGQIDKIKPNPEFKAAIDRYFASGQIPSKSEFALDPRLRYYMRNGFRPWLLLNDFIQDYSSGNKRVICFINLEQDDPAVYK